MLGCEGHQLWILHLCKFNYLLLDSLHRNVALLAVSPLVWLQRNFAVQARYRATSGEKWSGPTEPFEIWRQRLCPDYKCVNTGLLGKWAQLTFGAAEVRFEYQVKWDSYTWS